MIDSRMLITYIIVDIFCIIIVEVILKNLTSDLGSEQEIRLLRLSLRSYIAFMIAGLTGLIIENKIFFYSRVCDYLANSISLSCLGTTGFFWFAFVLLRTRTKIAATRKRFLTYIPAMITLLLCLSSPFTGLVFYIDSDNIYRRGPLFVLVSTVCILYMLAASVIAYVSAFHETQLSRKRSDLRLGVFLYLPLAASILQIWLAGMPILAPAIATSYYVVFSSIQGEMIYHDALTGMNNRRRAMFYLEERLALATQISPLTVFMIDGNKFKFINDTYGHIEGDSAIICMARAIQKVCGSFNLFGARYGGDEFILIGTNAHRSGAEVENEINRLLHQICEERKKPYLLSVTVGNYTTTGEVRDMDDLIARADTSLYARKKERN